MHSLHNMIQSMLSLFDKLEVIISVMFIMGRKGQIKFRLHFHSRLILSHGCSVIVVRVFINRGSLKDSFQIDSGEISND